MPRSIVSTRSSPAWDGSTWRPPWGIVRPSGPRSTTSSPGSPASTESYWSSSPARPTPSMLTLPSRERARSPEGVKRAGSSSRLIPAGGGRRRRRRPRRSSGGRGTRSGRRWRGGRELGRVDPEDGARAAAVAPGPRRSGGRPTASAAAPTGRGRARCGRASTPGRRAGRPTAGPASPPAPRAAPATTPATARAARPQPASSKANKASIPRIRRRGVARNAFPRVRANPAAHCASGSLRGILPLRSRWDVPPRVGSGRRRPAGSPGTCRARLAGGGRTPPPRRAEPAAARDPCERRSRMLRSEPETQFRRSCEEPDASLADAGGLPEHPVRVVAVVHPAYPVPSRYGFVSANAPVSSVAATGSSPADDDRSRRRQVRHARRRHHPEGAGGGRRSARATRARRRPSAAAGTRRRPRRCGRRGRRGGAAPGRAGPGGRPRRRRWRRRGRHRR